MAEQLSQLAKRLDLLRSRLDALWEATPDTETAKRQELQDQYDELDRQVMRLISQNVKDTGKEYEKAVDAIGRANTALGRALKDEEQFVSGMQAVAEALDLIAKVVLLG